MTAGRGGQTAACFRRRGAIAKTAKAGIAATLFALALSGCSTAVDPQKKIQQLERLRNGGGIDHDPHDAAKYRKNLDALLDEFKLAAGFESTIPEPKPDAQAAEGRKYWYPVTVAGANYIDRQCRLYMQALNELHRVRTSTSNQLTALGTTTTAIMGLASTSAEAIAIVASAFGLANITVDNIFGTFLYQLDPAAVNELVKAMQDEVWSKEIGNSAAAPSSKVAAVKALAAYASTCLPVTIEAAVNKTLRERAAASKTEPPQEQQTQQPATTETPAPGMQGQQSGRGQEQATPPAAPDQPPQLVVPRYEFRPFFGTKTILPSQ